ncbi:hypothetical protein H6G74_04795 [Nostoc spongiaeforme FACHB-130]|uniref:Uncharacterized protein n=1 Tax=Nostoc spongiaeforme FACHB-130 TaxID=1357510 RepID=A0ABR8FQF9_9NOSO|nr:hypothetical protein [Nostoc spongiaeforme]MBD2593647.1 hypothetical protein [Nostoc spongiaeforme FACHB-130]
MGAEPWHYFVPYEENVNFTLQNLRQQEFKAGNYYGSEFNPKSIDEAVANVEPDGTASILDMFEVTDHPQTCAVCPVPTDDLIRWFGTDKPTLQMVQSILVEEEQPDTCEEFWDSIGRGEGRYIIIYDEDEPFEIFFAGYSFD